MEHEIVFTDLAASELGGIRSFESRRLMDEIETQLAHEPEAVTKRKKILKKEIITPFEFSPPLRELRIGDYRAFYDVDSGAYTVTVRSVRFKPPHQRISSVRKVTPEFLSAKLQELLAASQQESVLVMREGKPLALLMGIEKFEQYDDEDWGYMTDPEFWKMIAERRKETKFVTLDEVRRRLAAQEEKESEHLTPAFQKKV